MLLELRAQCSLVVSRINARMPSASQNDSQFQQRGVVGDLRVLRSTTPIGSNPELGAAGNEHPCISGVSAARGGPPAARIARFCAPRAMVISLPRELGITRTAARVQAAV